MKKFLLSILCLLALTGTSLAGTGDIRLVIINSDGTYSEMPVSFSANGLISFGATPGTLSSIATTGLGYVTNGALTTTLAPYALNANMPDYRAGDITFTVAGGVTKAVTFSSSFTTGTSWRVIINTNLLTTGAAISGISASGFTVTLPVAVSGTMSYYAVPTK